MKWIIILLVLLNGGYFAWEYYEASSHNSVKSDLNAENLEHDSLVLLSEVSDERKELLGIVKNSEAQGDAAGKISMSDEKVSHVPMVNEKSDAGSHKNTQATNNLSEKNNPEMDVESLPAMKDSDVAKAKTITKHCYSIGPIKNRQNVTRLSKHINSMGLNVLEVRKTIDKVPSHWIYLSGYKSESEAKKEISRLASKGIKDTQMIKRSSTNMVISVGLFSTKDGADERLKNLQDAGFTPQTSMVTANKTMYYTDVIYKDGKPVSHDILASLIKTVSGAKVIEAECGK